MPNLGVGEGELEGSGAGVGAVHLALVLYQHQGLARGQDHGLDRLVAEYVRAGDLDPASARVRLAHRLAHRLALWLLGLGPRQLLDDPRRALVHDPAACVLNFLVALAEARRAADAPLGNAGERRTAQGALQLWRRGE
jgi:hypothetical protein